MRNTLILGYGNPDRQDDGIAWHILAAVASSLSYPTPSSWEEGFQPSPDHPGIELDFALQLTPEMAEKLAYFERVCFLDAHTGRVPDEVHSEIILPEIQNSPFTHHMTPSMLVYLTHSIYKKAVDAILISVRGYEFGFSHSLSSKTQVLLPGSVKIIFDWLKE